METHAASADIPAAIARAAEPLPDIDDPAFGRMFDRFANARVLLLGEALLANPNVRKFVDWVATKARDFTATTAKKQR